MYASAQESRGAFQESIGFQTSRPCVQILGWDSGQKWNGCLSCREGSAAEWALLLPAVLASASMRAAQGWLGYCPPTVRLEAGQLLDALDAGRGCR